jgi:hypothetical protein
MTWERTWRVFLLPRPSWRPNAVGDYRKVLSLEVTLGDTRFIPSPFLDGKKAHAGAEALVGAGGLTGILESRVAASGVLARALLARKGW